MGVAAAVPKSDSGRRVRRVPRTESQRSNILSKLGCNHRCLHGALLCACLDSRTPSLMQRGRHPLAHRLPSFASGRLGSVMRATKLPSKRRMLHPIF